ncbi:MAG: ATP-binding protein [Syntrophorhabdaceae bacterium]|nr:ATP-binding protein [Syntrophorhabdaceae bacterium]
MTHSSTLTLPATISNLERFLELVSKCALTCGMDKKRVTEIEIATEEALVNIIQHAYRGEKGEIEVECDIKKDTLSIKIIDYGPPFNILTLQDPDVNATLEERKIGGLGVFFMKKLMDGVDYKREGNKNILILTAYKDRTTEFDS